MSPRVRSKALRVIVKKPEGVPKDFPGLNRVNPIKIEGGRGVFHIFRGVANNFGSKMLHT